jgi:hypothetical protein
VGVSLNFAEIAGKSWNTYRRFLPALVLPLLALLLTSSAVSAITETGTVIIYHENRTEIISGVVHSGTPELMAEFDENYFEVDALGSGEGYGLEIWFDSGPVPVSDVSSSWVGAAISFNSENSANYHLEIYNFRTQSWELLRSEEVDENEIIWENIIKENQADYVNTSENFMRIRVQTSGEENAHRLRINNLIYGALRPPDLFRVWTANLGFALGIGFCFGIAIVSAQSIASRDIKSNGVVLKAAGRKLPRVFLAGIIPAALIFILAYFTLTAWGMFLFFPVVLLIFSCAYVLPEAVVRSSNPLKSLKVSFKLAWGNLGVTLILWVLFLALWFLIGPLPVVGGMAIVFLLPLWMVMLSVTYLDGARLVKPEGLGEEAEPKIEG